jgi:hypothetical protein
MSAALHHGCWLPAARRFIVANHVAKLSSAYQKGCAAKISSDAGPASTLVPGPVAPPAARRSWQADHR